MKSIVIFTVLFIVMNAFGCNDFKKSQQKDSVNRTHATKNSTNSSTNVQTEGLDSNLVLLKNKNSILPLNPSLDEILFIEQENKNKQFKEFISYYSTSNFISEFEILKDSNEIKKNTIVYLITNNKALNEGVNNRIQLTSKSTKKIALILCDGADVLDSSLYKNFDAIIWANHKIDDIQKILAQSLFGAKSMNGKLKQDLGIYQKESGLSLNSNGRLGFSSSMDFGIPIDSLNTIDRIAQKGITEGAYPGCQVLIAIKGKIIYNKSFGHHTYNSNSKKVDNQDIYDLASITKIASSTLLTMKLHGENQINLNNTLGYYLNDAKQTPYSDINLKSMLAHQAGFTAWIPFYKKTISEGKMNSMIYSKDFSSTFSNKVANNIYMNHNYGDSIYTWIYNTPLKSKTYRYSDLCFYFMKKILEKQTGKSLEKSVDETFYSKMGLQTICYNPLNKFTKERIAPTERDAVFRNQLVHGYVHDQGAAMQGGVGGHAGLFSNAYDLAVIMQLFLNKGNYCGIQYIAPKTIQEFTKQQYSNNRRGAGFDRPKIDGGGTCDILCSQKSFGHSGFTGTLAWADPENEVIVIFLSNRVYPDAQNWKLVKLNIRTDIQHEIYRLLNNVKK